MKSPHRVSFLVAASLLTLFETSIVYGGVVRVPQDYPLIQRAVDAAAPGDTILVAPGSYAENIMIRKALYLRSAEGASRTAIVDPHRDSSWGGLETVVLWIDSATVGEVSGFTIRGNYDTNGAGILLLSDGWRVSDCAITGHHTGVSSGNSSSVIVHNRFTSNREIDIFAGKNTIVTNNTMIGGNSTYDALLLSGRAIATNNLIANCVHGVRFLSADDSVIVRNNVITMFGDIYAGFQYGLWNVGSSNIIENNIVTHCPRTGVSGSPGNFRYNDVVDNVQDYSGESWMGKGGNISADPLFCDNDSLCFLASDSPCIDGGSELVVDPDGSRSDIGLYGGPNAEAVRYAPSSFDLLPVPAQSDTIVQIIEPFHEYPSTRYHILWQTSFHRNVGSVVSYRLILARSAKTYCGNPQCTTSQLRDVLDTILTASREVTIDLSAVPNGEYFYTVEAVDQTGLFKRARSIRSFSVLRYVLTPTSHVLQQNFPNPFNARTTIRFGIPPPGGRTTLKVYNVAGQEVASAIGGYLPMGWYSLVWNAQEYPSGVYFYRLQIDNVVKNKKLILIK